MWEFKWLLRLKLFPHILQGYGFSPVWILVWTFKVLRWVKCFPHILQENGFSPVWVLWCFSIWDRNLKALAQTSHVKDITAVPVRRWLSDAGASATLIMRHTSAFLVDSKSWCFPAFWSWLSATGKFWNRSWSSFGSGSLRSVSL